MSSYENYGPQHAEIESLIDRLRTITPKQALALHGDHNPTFPLVVKSRDAALKATAEAGRDGMWYQAVDEATMASRDAGMAVEWDVIEDSVNDALLALLAGDIIDAEHFNALYESWEIVMDEQEQYHNCEDEIRELVAALAVRDEQLATSRDDFRSSERESRRWKKRAKKAEAKLAEVDAVLLHIISVIEG
jgi:hypothetical protein